MFTQVVPAGLAVAVHHGEQSYCEKNMKMFRNVTIIVLLLIINTFAAQSLKEGDYEEFMSLGFEKLRPVKGLPPSGFVFDYDHGLATYRYNDTLNMKGVFAIVACGDMLDEEKLVSLRRICAERARGLVIKAWLERMQGILEEKVRIKLEGFQYKSPIDGSGKAVDAYEALLGYSVEYFYQQFVKYDFSCLCEGLLASCDSAFGDCALESGGRNVHFFYVEYAVQRGWDEKDAATRDCNSITSAISDKLKRDFMRMALVKPEAMSQVQIDEMRRKAVLIFALDNAVYSWEKYCRQPSSFLPECGVDWNLLMAKLFKMK